ncbi:hypothetical protein GCM10007977_087580 [Dactylosporangium sucinum]|uniref:Uncharacterized protein n=1 Tax=Dactylosporangium sucinum TaxID=1424081 RepID=A0A917UAI0_9ACTN|nr:hypothetical protein GCM10007977_087580 [Dactylosporangium sucinum]
MEAPGRPGSHKSPSIMKSAQGARASDSDSGSGSGSFDPGPFVAPGPFAPGPFAPGPSASG